MQDIIDRRSALDRRYQDDPGMKALQQIRSQTAASTVIAALEYACTIEADNRRGVWVKAYVEEQDWAIRDFVAWLEQRRAGR